MVGSVGEVVGGIVAVVAAGVVVAVVLRAMRIVQQGSVGVVKRLGEFRAIRQPGLHALVPFVDRMEKVDMREFPMTGDQQSVITRTTCRCG
jgi:regulator of protease activity HflC (stomatin/prohibitin superfamily)